MADLFNIQLNVVIVQPKYCPFQQQQQQQQQQQAFGFHVQGSPLLSVTTIP